MNYKISQLITESGLSEDEIRMMLSEHRSDYDTCKEVTKAERDLILGVAEARNTNQRAIAPTAGLPLDNQKAMVNAAAQVFGIDFSLSVAENIELYDAIDQVQNKIIVENHQRRKRELGQTLNADFIETKSELIGVLKELQGLLIPDVPIADSGLAASKEINSILQDLGNAITKNK